MNIETKVNDNDQCTFNIQGIKNCPGGLGFDNARGHVTNRMSNPEPVGRVIGWTVGHVPECIVKTETVIIFVKP